MPGAGENALAEALVHHVEGPVQPPVASLQLLVRQVDAFDRFRRLGEAGERMGWINTSHFLAGASDIEQPLDPSPFDDEDENRIPSRS